MRRWRAGWYPTCAISGAINSPDAIRTVVIDGALQHNGMVSFKTALKPEEVEDVRRYVIKRANEKETRYDVNRGGSCNATEMERHNG